LGELKIENISNFVKDYKTSFELGFTQIELQIILVKHPNIDSKLFWSSMYGNTLGSSLNGIPLYYHDDVITALKCGIEKRSINQEEWD